MPYSGSSDSNLPSYVKKMPVKKRRQWVAVFNKTYEGCEEKDGKECESAAFRAANGVTKEYISEILATKDLDQFNELIDKLSGEEEQEENTKEVSEQTGEKHYGEGYIYIPSNIKTFSGAQDYVEARKKQAEIDSLNHMFSELCSNIIYDYEMQPGEKASAVASLARELSDMLESAGSKEQGALGKLWTSLTGSRKEDGLPESTFFAFKDTQGNYRWLAIYTNNYYDKEQEVFPLVQHKSFVDYVDRTKDFPELWLWHTPGSRWGVADFVDLTDEGFVVASGIIDAGKESIAEGLAQKIASGEDIRLSHGYRFDSNQYDAKERAYGPYWTFEISPLPGERAENEGTGFYIGRDGYMPLTAEKRNWLVGLVGEDQTVALEKQISEMNKDLQAKGISFKGDVEPTEAPKAEEKKKEDEAPASQPATEASPNTTANTIDVNTLAQQIGAALMPQVTSAMDARFAELDKSVKDHQAETDKKIAQLTKSEEEKVDDRFRQTNASTVGDKASSNDDSNTVDEKEAADIMKRFGLTEGNNNPAKAYAEDALRIFTSGGMQ